MSRIRKNSSLLSELLAQLQEKENSRALIKIYLESLVDYHVIIDSADNVRRAWSSHGGTE